MHLIILKHLVKEFSEYLSILESFLENIDRLKNLYALNKFDLHRLTGKELFAVADNKVGSKKRGVRLSYQSMHRNPGYR